jgi:hypothetical protein
MKGVRTTHPDYNRMTPLWVKCADVAEGEHAVHSKGTLYLPKLHDEDNAAYQSRLKRTPLFNAMWRTIAGLKGMLFRKDASIDAPQSVIDALQDADLSGTPINSLAQEVVEEILTTGRTGLLVDYPSTQQTEGMTVAQVSRLGLRPVLAHYPAVTVINWRTARVGGVQKLVLVVLKESAGVPGEDEFAQQTEDRYRVLDLIDGRYRQRLYRIDKKGDDELLSEYYPLMRGAALSAIPFFILSSDSIGPRIESPPLLDLAEMNLHHYMVAADYEHGCHFSGLPTAVISGYHAPEGEKLVIGGKGIITLPDPAATAAYMEVQSDFEALRKNLQDKKAEMAVLGARMLENIKTGIESAETLKQRQAGEHSQLAAMADVVSMGITRVLKVFAEWMGASGEVSYQISKDFVPAGLTAQELTALVSAWQSGAISGQVLHQNLQAGEIIDGALSYEEEQERISSRSLGMAADDDPLPAVEPAAPAVDVAAIVEAIGRIPAPVVNYTPPAINIPATVVNIPEQQAPQITVNTPDITVNPASVTVNNLDGSKSIELQYDAEGNVTGGTVKPEGA